MSRIEVDIMESFQDRKQTVKFHQELLKNTGTWFRDNGPAFFNKS